MYFVVILDKSALTSTIEITKDSEFASQAGIEFAGTWEECEEFVNRKCAQDDTLHYIEKDKEFMSSIYDDEFAEIDDIFDN